MPFSDCGLEDAHRSIKRSGEARLPIREQQAVRQEEKLGYCVVLVEDVPLEPVGGD